MLTALMKKELLALRRDVHGLAALFLMPVLFIVVMSLALKDVYDPPLRALRYAIDVRDAGSAAQDLPRLWRQGHGEPQQGRLASTVRAEQPDRLAGVHRDRDAAKHRGAVAIAELHVAAFEQQCAAPDRRRERTRHRGRCREARRIQQ